MAFALFGYDPTLIKWFHAREVLRKTVLQDRAMKRLINFVRKTDKKVKLILSFAELDRIRTTYSVMCQFLDIVGILHLNITILSVCEFGVNLYSALKLISDRNTQRLNLHEECSHIIPEKNVPTEKNQEG